ncbi:hypothetical protein N500_0172 [Wolbachia pipientis wUni]|nr:hypothetical protein N500_0172 [Wolbachia pipientis wUni]
MVKTGNRNRSHNGVNLRKNSQRLCIKFLSKFFIIKLSKECKGQHFCFYFIATKKFKMCLF